MAPERRELKEGEYRVPKGNLPLLQKHLDKISKKGAKLGTGPVIYNIVEEEKVPEMKWDGSRQDYRATDKFNIYCILTIVGETPKIKGWVFKATIDFMHSEPVIRCVPGHDVPEDYQTAASWCDHCNSVRRRKETFVLQHEDTGEWKMVGRNCLRDFFGHDPARAARYLGALHGIGTWIGNELGDNSIRYDAYDLEKFLTQVAACIDDEGWVSRSKARANNDALDLSFEEDQARYLTATADLAWREIRNREKPPRRNWVPIPIRDEHQETAKDAITYARSLEDTSSNEYLNTLRIIAKDGYFSEMKEDGFAASMVAAYLRETKWKAEKAAREQATTKSEFVGEIGDKIEVEVTVDFVKNINTSWGGSELHNMTDENGNIFVWFASGKGFEKGDKLRIRGKVKRHNEYNKVKQTIINYVKEVHA